MNQIEYVTQAVNQAPVLAMANTIALIFRVAFGILVFTALLPMRSRRILRATVSLCALVALNQFVLTVYIRVFHVVPLVEHPSSVLFLMAYYTIIFAGFVVAVMLMYDVSIWCALFCCAAGYTLQNSASSITELIWMSIQQNARIGDGQRVGLTSLWCNLSVAVVVYGISFVLLLPYLRSGGIEKVRNRSLLLVMAAVSFLIIGFDLTVKYVADSGVDLEIAQMLRLVHICLCMFIIWMEFELLINNRLRADNMLAQHLLRERERQYQQSKQLIDAINIKSHDLKHQIRQLSQQDEYVNPQTIRNIETTIDQYDAAIRTGNEALDIIVTEKRMVCAQEGITCSVIADGAALDCMSDADIYSLFGNTFDNAIEAVRPLQDRRSMSLNIRRTKGVVSIHMENSTAGKVPIINGLPHTTKSDTNLHGFGTQSMREICEQYGATISFISEPQRFVVNILLPL